VQTVGGKREIHKEGKTGIKDESKKKDREKRNKRDGKTNTTEN
jgi:hypothetical protein